ncbi:MAG: hypothetical protein ABSH22_15555 [Tepidisphaeraceae bacterium]|jgi:hypothetical protein
MWPRKRPYDPNSDPLQAKWCARPELSDRAVARRLGIPWREFSRWLSEHPEFNRALDEGRDTVDVRVVEALYQRAIGGKFQTTEIVKDEQKKTLRIKQVIREYPPDVAAIIFFLRNRRPESWRSRPAEPPPEEIIAKFRPFISPALERFQSPMPGSPPDPRSNEPSQDSEHS